VPLQSEDQVHQEVMRKFEEVGWLNGNEKYGIAEHSLIDGYYLPSIIEEKVKEINEEIFSKLTLSEERFVLDSIHNELKNARLLSRITLKNKNQKIQIMQFQLSR